MILLRPRSQKWYNKAASGGFGQVRDVKDIQLFRGCSADAVERTVPVLHGVLLNAAKKAECGTGACGVTLSLQAHARETVEEEAVAKAQLFDGKLALITNTADIGPAEAVHRQKGLADIERGFRILKSDIEIAPAHHRLPERIRAHAFICFLALTLYRVMRMRLNAKGHSSSPKTALQILSRIQHNTTHIGKKRSRDTQRQTKSSWSCLMPR